MGVPGGELELLSAQVQPLASMSTFDVPGVNSQLKLIDIIGSLSSI